jgi:hypothetical protein
LQTQRNYKNLPPTAGLPGNPSQNNLNEYGTIEDERALGSGSGDHYEEKRGQAPFRGDPATGAKLSPHVFLLVISMYFLVCMMDTGLCVLLPVWMSSSVKKGGLGYTVTDIGTCLCIYKCVFIYIHTYIHE